MLYGVASYGERKMSMSAPTVNVAVSSAVDLFCLVTDRGAYARAAVQPVYSESGGKESYGFGRILGLWLSADRLVQYMEELAEAGTTRRLRSMCLSS